MDGLRRTEQNETQAIRDRQSSKLEAGGGRVSRGGFVHVWQFTMCTKPSKIEST